MTPTPTTLAEAAQKLAESRAGVRQIADEMEALLLKELAEKTESTVKMADSLRRLRMELEGNFNPIEKLSE